MTKDQQIAALREALEYIRNDLSYRAPEMVDPDVKEKYMDQIALASTPAAEPVKDGELRPCPFCGAGVDNDNGSKYMKDFLIGSSKLPATITLNGGTLITLGEVVASAHKRSGLTIEQWNSATQGTRDDLLHAEIRYLNAAQKP